MTLDRRTFLARLIGTAGTMILTGVVDYDEQPDQTVLGWTAKHHEKVVAQHHEGLGALMIVQIAGVTALPRRLIYTVNGTLPDVPADQYRLKPNDCVTWHAV